MEQISSDVVLGAQWARVRGRLRDEVGEAAFRSWLNPLQLAGVRDGAVKMALPTRFMRDWVMTHYADRLRNLWTGEDPGIRSVEIVVAQFQAAAQAQDEGDTAAEVPVRSAPTPNLLAKAPCHPP